MGRHTGVAAGLRQSGALANTLSIASGKRLAEAASAGTLYYQRRSGYIEYKAADIIGLYLNPLRHAAVFYVDEKTAIQAGSARSGTALSPGRAERHRFEYYGHGTLSLNAALDTASRRVYARLLLATLAETVSPSSRKLSRWAPDASRFHIILDNLSAHKTTLVREFLEQNPRVHFHFTPTYSSWLNQVELWFARIERDVIARGIFRSVSDLARKLRRYINAYSANARPFQWKYSDPTRRIRTNDFTATGH